MKKIYSPIQIYNFIKKNHIDNTSLAYTLPPLSFCTENISWKELLMNQTELPSLEVLINLCMVANRLQAFRDTVFKAEITISSAWRSEAYNKKIGGEPMSKHILGQAVDFNVKDFPPSKVQFLLEKHSGGLGVYKSFTHMDTAAKRRWVG